VTLDTAAPETVFVMTMDGSVWKSRDGAMTWQKAGSGE
jgi:hypothetical protein